MEKLIRINDLINITGFLRLTITKLLKNIATRGSSNSIYNSQLRLYGVRDINKCYEKLSFINNKGEIQCQQENKDCIKEVKSTGYHIQKEENNISYQLRKWIFKKQ